MHYTLNDIASREAEATQKTLRLCSFLCLKTYISTLSIIHNIYFQTFCFGKVDPGSQRTYLTEHYVVKSATPWVKRHPFRTTTPTNDLHITFTVSVTDAVFLDHLRMIDHKSGCSMNPAYFNSYRTWFTDERKIAESFPRSGNEVAGTDCSYAVQPRD